MVVVRKLGAPGRPELGIGAIGEDGIRALNQDLIDLLGVTSGQLADVETKKQRSSTAEWRPTAPTRIECP